MKTGYFDCFAGAGGDMVVAAMLDAGLDEQFLRAQLATLGVDKLEVEISETIRHGIRAVSFGPVFPQQQHHRNLEQIIKIINENENVMVICGRMGPMCIPVYRIAYELQDEFPHVKFFDMEFDNPEANVIRNLPEVRGFMGIPFTIYYKNGKVVKATSSIQSKQQVTSILEEYLGASINA